MFLSNFDHPFFIGIRPVMTNLSTEYLSETMWIIGEWFESNWQQKFSIFAALFLSCHLTILSFYGGKKPPNTHKATRAAHISTHMPWPSPHSKN